MNCAFCKSKIELLDHNGWPLYYFGSGPNNPQDAKNYFAGQDALENIKNKTVDICLLWVYFRLIQRRHAMTNAVKVTNYTYTMIEKFFDADIVQHGFFVGSEQVGFMEVVDQDEDRMFFDHYVREDFFNKYQEETL